MPPVLYSLVLSARGETAADVALGLVLLEDLLHLQIQRPVVDRQPLGQVLMYGCRLLERFRLSLNLQANAGKCLHCPLDRPQSSE